jgi:phosphoglycerate kinase
MHSIVGVEVAGKKVIVRGDLDLAEEGSKIESFRLLRMIPTLKNILDRGGIIRLIAHRGRPEGTVVDSLSLQEFVPLLSEKLDHEVIFAGDFIKDPNPNAEIALFENLRFHDGEESNDPEFAQSLAKLGEIYVNECFSTSHRNHASFVSLPKLLPHFAGINLIKEIEEMTKILQSPKHPLVVIIGGAKLETKLPTIEYLSSIADQILVGSSFLNQGLATTDKIIIPTDSIGQNQDIGQRTIDQFRQVISSAQTIVWNGPLGMFEDRQFASGTREIAQAVADSSAYSVVGGGDTIAALDEIGMLEKISFVSTGGGAMLEFLSGKKLPGLVALD